MDCDADGLVVWAENHDPRPRKLVEQLRGEARREEMAREEQRRVEEARAVEKARDFLRAEVKRRLDEGQSNFVVLDSAAALAKKLGCKREALPFETMPPEWEDSWPTSGLEAAGRWPGAGPLPRSPVAKKRERWWQAFVRKERRRLEREARKLGLARLDTPCPHGRVFFDCCKCDPILRAQATRGCYVTSDEDEARASAQDLILKDLGRPRPLPRL